MINLGILAVFLCAGYFFGSYSEKKHYKNIIDREKKYNQLPVSSFTWKERNKFKPKPDFKESQIFIGETVVASDYFKTFVSSLRNIIGGRLKSYESLLDRGRREATLRMISKANKWGAKEIINLKVETSNINSAKKKKGMPIIEVMVYATALK